MSERGFGLLEWVVAMGLYAAVTLVLVQLLMIGRGQVALVDGMATLTDRGRFAQTMIQQALQKAHGQLPCGRGDKSPSDATIAPLIQPQWLPHNAAVFGVEAAGTDGQWRLAAVPQVSAGYGLSLPEAITRRIDAQSDLLLVFDRHPLPNAWVTEFSQFGFAINRAVADSACALWVVSDCTTDIVFQNTASKDHQLSWQPGSCGPGNQSMGEHSLANTWPRLDHLALYRWTVEAWFVGLNDTDERVLYRVQLHQGQHGGRVEEMVEGIESLQLEYAFGSPAGLKQWHNASAVADWRLVEAVRIGIVASVPMSRHAPTQGQGLSVLSSKMTWSSTQHWMNNFDSAVALRAQRFEH